VRAARCAYDTRDEALQRLLDNAGGLGEKFGPVLFQFPRRWALDL
jgi:uncharacterized protein YecE (DUF72 family)